MPGDKFVPTCCYYVGDAMLVLHPHEEDSGALASSIVWLACACQGCPINCVWRCAPVVRFAAPPLTGAGEPKTWLVRLLRRDCWPEFGENFVYRSGLRVELQRPHAGLSLLLAGKFFSSRLELGIIRDGFPVLSENRFSHERTHLHQQRAKRTGGGAPGNS